MSATGATPADPHFGFAPDPDQPGWMRREAVETGAFIDVFGTMHIRVEASDRVRLRVQPGPQHRNLMAFVHGGFMLALVDQALFAATTAVGIPGAAGGVTIDCATQFLDRARLDVPLDAIVEILRETGRLVFLRGTIEQEGTRVLAFSGTIRKGRVTA
ncbi:PaaI family thioesterase [Sphingomonas solaris]|uniref:PaaI family thioesterase n=1 Tax=Alterirhizorhabdus solaris TaxID=2529389 RepID=A0A558R6Q7_9SPHN|nr:PaaI family thioesterase [Sphingomonas solaris]TVV75057.1 PaaI family thioesterase [Sphingomonas solaris]